MAIMIRILCSRNLHSYQLCKDQPINFRDIVKIVQSLPREKRQPIRNVLTIIKIILTNGVTSATTSTMTQKRFNSLSLLNNNQAILDKMSLIDVANEFVNVQPTRLNVFRTSLKKICNILA